VDDGAVRRSGHGVVAHQEGRIEPRADSLHHGKGPGGTHDQ
jgi:hypothetical protein